MRLLCAVLMLAIGYLCYDIYVGRNGYVQYEQIAAQLKQAQARSTLLEQRNLAVQDELNDLKQGNAAIEELARSELGLIKEGETFYRVIGTQ
ncbi:MAG: septum formation initiator family protein [Candidatus Anaerobiospirillum merdipullorum]|uniref:Cell division protein FtsB n=1 Tax=Candidatus Anaerobiospirillum merdipullorum TaxID=2838450 RepID=A0A9E2KLW5_9GAMM|nr:septum formation initiator family protein [Candidatus Anaerobiospirillum merdipullorum]